MITIHNADAITWAEKYSGEPFHALLCDPPYHLTSIVKRFGRSSPADVEKNATNRKIAGQGASPYGRVARGFMGNTWDGGDLAFRAETWETFGRVLFPGAFGMAFSSSRGWHRMAVAIEDAGFIIHPTIFLWNYASGFPKATRVKGTPAFSGHRYGLQALKPAVEPILVFQKPYEGRAVDNITQTGAGALNVEAGRIGTEEIPSNQWSDNAHPFGGGAGNEYKTVNNKGRWPANFILGDREAAEALDEQTGVLTSGEPAGLKQAENRIYGQYGRGMPLTGYGDSGGASRFFYRVQEDIDEADPVYYCAKASPTEREVGLDEMEKVAFAQSNGGQAAIKRGEDYQGAGAIALNRVKSYANPHPTVKPIDLARYLAALLLPPAEYYPRRLFVPFAGVASECIGAHLAGWDEIVGVESDTKNNYVEIANKRIAYWAKPVAIDLFTNKTVE